MTILKNHLRMKSRRRELRKNQTEAERKLWAYLRGRRLKGFRFWCRGERPLARTILDFYCSDHKLAVELDGSHHLEPEVEAYDQKRTWFLEKEGIKVLRFYNFHVMEDVEIVLDMILEELEG